MQHWRRCFVAICHLFCFQNSVVPVLKRHSEHLRPLRSQSLVAVCPLLNLCHLGIVNIPTVETPAFLCCVLQFESFSFNCELVGVLVCGTIGICKSDFIFNWLPVCSKTLVASAAFIDFQSLDRRNAVSNKSRTQPSSCCFLDVCRPPEEFISCFNWV